MKRTFRLALFLSALLAGPAVGPLAAAESWEPTGPPGGTASLLIVHPRNPQLLWAGSYWTGLFRSVDGGASWSPADRGMFPNLRSLAVAPSDPRILHAIAQGTNGFGAFRSVDRGLTWTLRLDCRQQPLPCCGCIPLGTASELVVHPRNPRVVFAATAIGLFKSVDGGAVWRRTGRRGELPRVSVLVFHPEDPDILYAGGDGVWKSEDGGETWVPWRTGMTDSARGISRIVIDPKNPRRMWAGGSSHGLSRSLYRSTDGGAHWRRLHQGLGPNREVRELVLSPAPGRGWPVLWLVTGTGLYRSVDGGVTWDLAGGNLQGRQIEALAAHPDRPGILWAGITGGWGRGESGIYKTVDGGVTWHFSRQGFQAILVTALAFDPAAPDVLWVGSRGSGVQRGTGGGAAWTPRNGAPGQRVPDAVLDLAVDPRDPETVWAAGYLEIHVTEDGGATWEDRSEGLIDPGTGSVPTTLVVRLAPSVSSVAYTGSPAGLFKTVDAGAHWTRLDALPFPEVADVWVDPRDPDVVFAAAGSLWISRDGGLSWEEAPVWNAPTAVLTLAADPRNPDVVYAGGEDGVFRSADNGRTWQRVAPFPLEWTRDLTVDPTGAVWALNALGIFRSSDGLSGWTLVPGSEELVAPLEIEADPHHPGTVLVGTMRSVFRWGRGAAD